MEQLTGNEEFTLHGASAGISVKDYWSWAYSDLIDNTQRGVMAEFLVYSSLTSRWGGPPRPPQGPLSISSRLQRPTPSHTGLLPDSTAVGGHKESLRSWNSQKAHSPLSSLISVTTGRAVLERF